MKMLITYTEEQVAQIKGLLNGLTVTGIQNCKQVAAVVQILESGIPCGTKKDELKKKEGEG